MYIKKGSMKRGKRESEQIEEGTKGYIKRERKFLKWQRGKGTNAKRKQREVKKEREY